MYGIIIPLEYLDAVINSENQIFIIESLNVDKDIPVASLNTRLGGNVVSANHCQAKVSMQLSKISYIENKVLYDEYHKKKDENDKQEQEMGNQDNRKEGGKTRKNRKARKTSNKKQKKTTISCKHKKNKKLISKIKR